MMPSKEGVARSAARRPRPAADTGAPAAWRGPLVSLLLGLGLLACIGFALPAPTTALAFPVDHLPLGVALQGIYGFEQGSAGTYAWTKPQARLSLPAAGAGRYRLSLALQSSPAAGPRLVRVFADGQHLGSVVPDATPRSYTFDWDIPPGRGRPGVGDLQLDLETAPFYPPADDRALGIIVSRVALERSAPSVAPVPALLAWLGLVAGLLIAGQLGGVPWAWRNAALAALVAAALALLARDRELARQLAAQPPRHPWLLLNGIALVTLGALALGPIARRPVVALAGGAPSVVPAALPRRRAARRRAVDLLASVLPLAWMLVVVVATTDAALVAWASIAPLLRSEPRRVESLQFAAAIFAYSLLGPCAIRAVKPSLTIPTLAIIFAVAVVVFAAGAGAFVALLLLVALVVAWCELGQLALRLLGLRPRADWASGVLAFAAGSGLFALWVLLVGVFGLLYPPAIVAPVALLVASPAARALLAWRATGWRRWSRSLAAGRPVPSWLETILLGQVVGFALLGLAAGFGPEVSSDAYRVHLVLARQYVAEHRVFALPEQSLTYWPIHGQMLFAAGTMLGGLALAKLIHAAAGLAAIAGVGAGGALLGRSRTAGIVAAALFASQPLVTSLLGVGYTDLFEALYSAAALICLLRLLVSYDWRWSLLLGAMLGLGVAAKLRSGLRVVATGLALVAGAGFRPPLRALPRLAAACAVGFALTGGLWVLRTIWLTGTVPGLSPLLATLGVRPSPSIPIGGSDGSITAMRDRGIGSLARLPWALSFDSALFGEYADGILGFALLLLLPCLLALPRRRRVIAALVFVAVPLLLWFSTIQYLRYLLPTFAALATVLGAAVVAYWGRLARYRSRGAVGARAGRVHAAALAAILLSSVLFYFATFFVYPRSLPTRVVLGREGPGEYLSYTLSAHDATRYLDRLVPPGAAVAALPDGPGLYTHARLITPFRVNPMLIYAATVPALRDLLASYGITYLLIDHNAVPSTWAGFLIVRPDFLATQTDRVFTAGGATIYRLRPPGDDAGDELLRDPGFEAVTGRSDGWQPLGDAPAPAAAPNQGRTAIAVVGRAGYYQAASVREGQGYRLRYVARSDQPEALAELRIDWFNSAGMLVESATAAAPLTTAWAEYSLWRPAPAGATTAVVYILARNATTCWFDDYSFRPAD